MNPFYRFSITALAVMFSLFIFPTDYLNAQCPISSVPAAGSFNGGTVQLSVSGNNINGDIWAVTASDDDIWSFVFNYQSPSCNGPDGNLSQSVVGGVLRANNSASDFALFELSSSPPANYSVYYAGWSNQNQAASSTVGIHHPSGDVKKISFNQDPVYSGTWNDDDTPVANGDHWVVDDWEDGTTEPGSSGSPLFNQNKLIIGQLHGGAAACSNVDYDTYGKLYSSWEGGGTPSRRLKDWLGEGVSTLQGA